MPKLSTPLLAAALLLTPFCGNSPRAGEPATFKLSLDPTVAVLSVTYTTVLGGGGSREHVLYGDGRLEIRERGRHGDVHERYETWLTHAERDELLRSLIDRGIIETTVDDIMAKIKKSLPPGHSTNVTEDAGDMILEVHVESYSRGIGKNQTVAKRLTIHAPKVMYHLAPHIPELQAISDLTDRMSELYREVVEKSKEPAQ